MKVCPICKARCFDDMEVCYGCMHRFDFEDEEPLIPAAEEEIGTFPEPAAPDGRKHPLRSAYVFGASGAPSNERDSEESPSAVRSGYAEVCVVDSDSLESSDEAKRSKPEPASEAEAGKHQLQPRIVGDGEVVHFLQAALESGRRLFVCVD